MKSLGLFWKETYQQKHESLKAGFFELGSRIDWQMFEPLLEQRLGRINRDLARGGRPPFDAVKMFKILVLQHYYQVGDDMMEFQLYDRLSFRQFVGFVDGDRLPDAKTIWLFRDTLAQMEAIEPLFDLFGQALDGLGLKAHGGQMVDASINEVRKPRSLDEKEYKTPAARAQHDTDATFSKKGNSTYFGYKNHVGIDKQHKFIRTYTVSSAAPHDSQFLEMIFDDQNTSSRLYADSAYRGGPCDVFVETKGLTDLRQHRAYRNRPLNGHKKRSNRARSQVRAHVEHVFAAGKNWGKRIQIRTIGMPRAAFTLGLGNLIHNMRRFILFENRGLVTP